MDNDLLERYNYDEFVPEKFEPWMTFDDSPPLGEVAPDFPIWHLDNHQKSSLKALWSNNTYLVVEFGSFT